MVRIYRLDGLLAQSVMPVPGFGCLSHVWELSAKQTEDSDFVCAVDCQ